MQLNSSWIRNWENTEDLHQSCFAVEVRTEATLPGSRRALDLSTHPVLKLAKGDEVTISLEEGIRLDLAYTGSPVLHSSCPKAVLQAGRSVAYLDDLANSDSVPV